MLQGWQGGGGSSGHLTTGQLVVPRTGWLAVTIGAGGRSGYTGLDGEASVT